MIACIMEWSNCEYRIAIVTLHHGSKSAADVFLVA